MSFYVYISYIVYILIYIYANVLNAILFQSILTNILCMFYVPIKNIIIIHACIIIFILYTLPVFYMFYCCHFKYSVCFLCFMSRCFTLVCRKIAQMS